MYLSFRKCAHYWLNQFPNWDLYSALLLFVLLSEYIQCPYSMASLLIPMQFISNLITHSLNRSVTHSLYGFFLSFSKRSSLDLSPFSLVVLMSLRCIRFWLFSPPIRDLLLCEFICKINFTHLFQNGQFLLCRTFHNPLSTCFLIILFTNNLFSISFAFQFFNVAFQFNAVRLANVVFILLTFVLSV